MEMAFPVVESNETTAGTPPERSRWSSSEFAAVYEAHGRQIYYLALRFLGDPALAEDAAHDVFLKAYRKCHEFRGEAAIRTWLYRIAVNHCQNLLQSWHRRHIITVPDDFLWDTAPATTDSPLHVIATGIQSGLFAADGFRHAFLNRLRRRTPSGLAYEAEVDAVLDRLADHLTAHLALDRLQGVARGHAAG